MLAISVTTLPKPERLLWQRLRRRQLNGFKFRRQRAIGRYVCDFVCLEAGVVIELDGSQHVSQSAYDEQRDAFLIERLSRTAILEWHRVLGARWRRADDLREALTRRDLEGRFN